MTEFAYRLFKGICVSLNDYTMFGKIELFLGRIYKMKQLDN